MNRYKLSKAGIDVNEGAKRFRDNLVIYQKFLFTFPEDENYGKMMEAIEQKDAKSAFAYAHALKGVTGNLSINDLYHSLLPMVEELRAGSMDKIEEFLPEIRENYDRAATEIKAEREAKEE